MFLLHAGPPGWILYLRLVSATVYGHLLKINILIKLKRWSLLSGLIYFSTSATGTQLLATKWKLPSTVTKAQCSGACFEQSVLQILQSQLAKRNCESGNVIVWDVNHLWGSGRCSVLITLMKTSFTVALTLSNQLHQLNRRMSNVNLATIVDRGTKDHAARQSLDDSNHVLLVPLSGWGVWEGMTGRAETGFVWWFSFRSGVYSLQITTISSISSRVAAGYSHKHSNFTQQCTLNLIMSLFIMSLTHTCC